MVSMFTRKIGEMMHFDEHNHVYHVSTSFKDGSPDPLLGCHGSPSDVEKPWVGLFPDGPSNRGKGCKVGMSSVVTTQSRWWQLRFFFHPENWGRSILTNIFPMGWNHQLAIYTQQNKPQPKPMHNKSCTNCPIIVQEVSQNWCGRLYAFFQQRAWAIFFRNLRKWVGNLRPCW